MARAARVAAGALLIAAHANAITLCTTPDGKKYAGDNPPAGCVVDGKFDAAPPPMIDSGEDPATAAEQENADRESVQRSLENNRALSRVRQLSSAIEKASRDLASVKSQIANMPYVHPENFANTPEGLRRYRQALQNRRAMLHDLYDRRSELQSRIADMRAERAQITGR